MDFSDRDGVIWMDGELVPWRDAKVHVLTHTLHYGMGVFEGVRAYHTNNGTSVFRLKEHTDRLFRSAHILNMPMPFDKDTLNEAQLQVIRENTCSSRPMSGPSLIWDRKAWVCARTISRCMSPSPPGSGARIWGRRTWSAAFACRTSSYTRHHVNVTMCKAKATGNYTNSIMALQEALTCGYDEALLLDNEGYVQEGQWGKPLSRARRHHLHP